MSSAFPNMIPNEPPPLDFDDDDDETGEGDYAEFTSRGLRLDILGEPSPQSSPQRKLPVVAATPDKVKICPKDNLGTAVSENHYATINGTSLDGHQLEPDNISDANVKKITPEPYSTPAVEIDCSPSPTVPSKFSSEESSSEEQPDDFGDFRSSEFSTVLSDENAPPELPVTSTSKSNDMDSPEEHWEETNGGQDEFGLGLGISIGEEEFVTRHEELSDSDPSRSVHFEDLCSADVELGNEGFEDFQTGIEEVKSKTAIIPTTTELEDDFGDFSNVLPSTHEQVSSVSPSVELDDDEFGDFSSEVIHVQNKATRDVILPQKSNLLDADSQDVWSETNVLPVSEPIQRLCPQTDDFEDDDDFGDFCSNSNVTPRPSIFEAAAVVSASLPPLPLRTTLIGSSSSHDIEFEEIPPVPTRSRLEKTNSTEFFPPSLVTHSTPPNASSSSNVAADPAFSAEFGDFLSSELNDQVQSPVKFTRKDSQMETRFDSLVSSVFDQPSAIPANSLHSKSLRHIDKELEGKANHAWTHIQDFEDSHIGLKFKWLNSIAHRHLLSSLKVDSSTILYSGRWGAIEVPKFAAHLADIPLQPLQPESSLTSFRPSSSSSPSDFQEFQSHKPVMNSNNSDENHRSSTQNTFKETKISEGTLAQISDLSYTRTTRTTELVFPSTPMFNE